MSKKSPAPTRSTKRKLKFEYPSRRDWDACFRAYYDKEVPPGSWQEPVELVFSCAFLNEPTCCGFNVVGDFYGSLTPDRDFGEKLEEKPSPEVIGEGLVKALKRWKRPYFAAYVPDTKDYADVRAILEAAGFKRAIAIPSTHGRGRYTNTRWEWFSPVKEQREKIIRTIPV